MAPVPGSPWKCVSRMTSLPPSPHTQLSFGCVFHLQHTSTIKFSGQYDLVGLLYGSVMLVCYFFSCFCSQKHAFLSSIACSCYL